MLPFLNRLLASSYDPYFPEDLENFAIILKGRSVERLPSIADRFEHCFIVNNFDPEFEIIGQHLVGKKIVHFVNRLMTAPLRAEHYNELGIENIQLPKSSALGDRELRKSIRHYKSLGLEVHYLPHSLLDSFEEFGEDYRTKFPNTGLLAILFALKLIRPKQLWIAGLDFYQEDYLVRRPHQSAIENQRRKTKRLQLTDVFERWTRKYPDIQFNLVTYADLAASGENVALI